MFEELVSRFEAAGQGHVLALARGFATTLAEPEREALHRQLTSVDLGEVARLWQPVAEPDPPGQVLEEHPTLRPDARERERLEQLGREHLAAGKVAVLTVAGGEGTRLGFDAPKGCYPISPVREASLYRLFAEGLVAARSRYGAAIPWILMTSTRTDAPTRQHLDSLGDWLGDGRDPGYRTTIQGTRPVLDLRGQLLMASRDRLAVAPDGHGGAVAALARPGLLAELADGGIETLFYHQVDNPLGRRPDPVLIGAHVDGGAEATAKVVARTDPDEKVGVVCRRDGRPGVVEYSELTADQSRERRADGRLRFDAGNIAVHTFDIEFLARVAAERMPVHRALKVVPHVDAAGQLVRPTAPNAVKFESFIFDLLPLASRFVCLEVDRDSEFHPLKDAQGPFSADEVRRALSRWWGGWLVARGLELPRSVQLDGSTPIEVSPTIADDARELPLDTHVECDESGRILLA